MNVTTILMDLINGYKTYAAAILMVSSGVGAILAKDQNQNVADFLQALALVFGGIIAIGLRHAIAKVPREVLTAARDD